jgi:hypothetical protein
MHLVQNVDMLGANCIDFAGGYPKKVIDQTIEYMSNNYRRLVEVTPRQAIKIADIIHHNGYGTDLTNRMLQQLWK